MPHPDLDLPNLRAIAEAATAGEWKKRSASLPWDIRASGSPVAEVYSDEDGMFVTTFSPPTVLALIARAEKAEAALEEINQAAHTAAVDKLMSLHPWERAWANTIALEVLRAYLEAISAQAAKGGSDV